jgi:hypothetical protein
MNHNNEIRPCSSAVAGGGLASGVELRGFEPLTFDQVYELGVGNR